MNLPRKVALWMAGCAFAAFFLIPLRGCDYVDKHDGFEIEVKRASWLTTLAGVHGRSETAVLRIAGEEFRTLAGRSPHCIRDPQAKWLVCVATENWPGNVIVIIDESSRKFATAESPLSGFGAFIGMEDNTGTAKYDRDAGTLTLTDTGSNRSAVLKDLNWRKY